MALHIADYNAVRRDLTQVFREALASATPIYPQFCTVVDSRGADEAYGWLGDVPGVREWIGARHFKQLRAADYILPNRHWESSLELERTSIDDDRYGIMRPRISDLATEARYHPDELLFEAVNAGESKPCFDGQNFFDTDHEWGDSGTQSNIVTETGTGDVNNPTVEEWKTSFHNALIRMMSFKNDQGKYLVRPVAGRMGSLVAVIPLNMWRNANEALRQIFGLQTEGTSFAATTNVWLEQPTLVPVQYYGATDAWDLYYTGGSLKPYVFQEREMLKFQTKGFDDIEFKVIKAMTEARYNVGYLAWWTAVRNKFTA